MYRLGFTLIELIFTIVILGFIVMALPTMITTDSKGRSDALVQEAIYASSAKMSQILSYNWDNLSNIETAGTISMGKVLDVPLVALNTDGDLQRFTGKFRRGHFQRTGRRSLYTVNTGASIIANLGTAADANDIVLGINDIDDSDALGAAFLTASNDALGNPTAHGYKENYTIDIASTYVIDLSATINGYDDSVQNNFEFENAAASPTHIKRILITIMDGNNQVLFSLRTYASNIGETAVMSRVFQ